MARLNSWAPHKMEQKNYKVIHFICVEYLFQWLLLAWWKRGDRAR